MFERRQLKPRSHRSHHQVLYPKIENGIVYSDFKMLHWIVFPNRCCDRSTSALLLAMSSTSKMVSSTPPYILLLFLLFFFLFVCSSFFFTVNVGVVGVGIKFCIWLLCLNFFVFSMAVLLKPFLNGKKNGPCQKLIVFL